MADPSHSVPPGGGQPDHGSMSDFRGQRKSKAGPGSAAGQGAGGPGGSQSPQQVTRQLGSDGDHGSTSCNRGQRKSMAGSGSAAVQGAGGSKGVQRGSIKKIAPTVPLHQAPTLKFELGPNYEKVNPNPLSHMQWEHIFNQKKLHDGLSKMANTKLEKDDLGIKFTHELQQGDQQWIDTILEKLDDLSTRIRSAERSLSFHYLKYFEERWKLEKVSKQNLVTCLFQRCNSTGTLVILADEDLKAAEETTDAILKSMKEELKHTRIQVPLPYFDESCFQQFVQPEKRTSISVWYERKDENTHTIHLLGPVSECSNVCVALSPILTTLKMEKVKWSSDAEVWVSQKESQVFLEVLMQENCPGVLLFMKDDHFLIGGAEEVLNAQQMIQNTICTEEHRLSVKLVEQIFGSIVSTNVVEEVQFIPEYYLLASFDSQREILKLTGPKESHSRFLQIQSQISLKNPSKELKARIQSAAPEVSLRQMEGNSLIGEPILEVETASQLTAATDPKSQIGALEEKAIQPRKVSRETLIELLQIPAMKTAVEKHLDLPKRQGEGIQWRVDRGKGIAVTCKDKQKCTEIVNEIWDLFAEREFTVEKSDSESVKMLLQIWHEFEKKLHEFYDCLIASLDPKEKVVHLVGLRDRVDAAYQQLTHLMKVQKACAPMTIELTRAEHTYLMSIHTEALGKIIQKVEKKGGTLKIHADREGVNFRITVTGSTSTASEAVKSIQLLRNKICVEEVKVSDALLACLASTDEGKRFVESVEDKYNCCVVYPNPSLLDQRYPLSFAEGMLPGGTKVSVQQGPLRSEGVEMVALPIPVEMGQSSSSAALPVECPELLRGLGNKFTEVCKKLRNSDQRVALLPPPRKTSLTKVVLFKVPSEWNSGTNGEKDYMRSSVNELFELVLKEQCLSVAIDVPIHLPVKAAETQILYVLSKEKSERGEPFTRIKSVKLFTKREGDSAVLLSESIARLISPRPDEGDASGARSGHAEFAPRTQNKIAIAGPDQKRTAQAAHEVSKFQPYDNPSDPLSTSGINMSAGVNKLPEEMMNRLRKCEKCQENFQSPQRLPRMLPCHHTLCEQCLQQLTKDKSLRCPMCHRSITVEGKFPIETTRMTILDLTNVMGSHEGSECHGCSKGTKASYKCLQCEDLLCEDCRQAHKAVRITKDHILVSLTEAASNPSKLLLLTEKCSEHKEKNLKFFCPGCKETACSSCIVARHNGHKMDNLEAVLEEQRKELKAVCGRLATAMPKYQSRVDLSAANLNTLDDHKSKISDKIWTLFSEARKVLDDREKQILADFGAKVKEDRLGLEEQQAKDESLLSEAQASLQFGQDVAFLGLPSQLLSGPQELTRTCDDLESRSADPSAPVPMYQVDSSNLEGLAGIVKVMGNVSSKSSGSKTQRKKQGNQTRMEEQVPREAAAGETAEVAPEKATGADNKITLPGGLVVIPYRADITKLKVDAVVNAANEHLVHGEGVARAIADAAGPDLIQECQHYIDLKDPIPVSEVCVTGPGRLPCTRVIHAVGPRWDSRTPELCRQQLYNAVLNCCREADKWDLGEIAMPPISSGIFGMPKDQCTEMYCKALLDFDQQPNKKLKTIHFVDINDDMPLALLKALRKEIGQGQQRTRPPEADVDLSQGCVICTEKDFNQPVKLNGCNHVFCKACIEQWFQSKPTCPSCNKQYGIITGTMPWGTMKFHHDRYTHLAGFENCGCIVINYSFSDGFQKAEHPNPGQPYKGARRTAYLPDNAEGNKVLRLLQEAWSRKLTFTIGRSTTTGQENVVTWNGIHHKTSIRHGNPFGYPDPDYLTRVQEELAARGVTEESIKLAQSGNPQDFSQFYTPLRPRRPTNLV